MFDCAFKATQGERSIHYMGHIKMMGATQPFISGAISKTVNVPREATVEDIEQAYLESWRLGAKADLDLPRRQQADAAAQHVEGRRGRHAQRGRVAVEVREVVKEVVKIVETPKRRKLPDERHSITHKFDIAGHEGYITVGLFEDGTPGEIFLMMAKEGSTISGFADAFAQAISYALQYGVPLQALVDKFSHARFEPSGMTKNPEVRFAKSIVDYIFRWMATKFLSPRGAVPRRREHARGAAGSAIGDRGSATSGVAVAPCPRRPASRRVFRPACSRGTEGRSLRVRGDAEPGRRAAVQHVRVDHDPQRQLLQVHELRHDVRLRLTSSAASIYRSGLNAAP